MRDRVKLQSWPVRTVVLLLLLALSSVHGLSRVSMTEDGGYANIVIKIRKEVSEDDCPDILRGIKVIIQKRIFRNLLCTYFLVPPTFAIHRKKGLRHSRPHAGMSLTKLFLGGNNLITPAQRMSLTFFLQCTLNIAYRKQASSL
jgi:hypothetical protein